MHGRRTYSSQTKQYQFTESFRDKERDVHALQQHSLRGGFMVSNQKHHEVCVGLGDKRQRHDYGRTSERRLDLGCIDVVHRD